MTGYKLALALCAASALAACNSTRSAPPAVSAAPAPAVGASRAPLPEGDGCGAQIARFQAVIESDRDTGNVNAGVFKSMSADVARASSACNAGRDGEALASLRATKSRYGYP